ncbi:MAG: hypothetical protein QXY10_02645 [Candidatus Micrarchaeaceae archaeon]
MMDIEKAKNVAEAIKHLDLPEAEKKIAITQVAMGVPAEAIIDNLINIYNDMETKKAEKTNPKPKLPKGYTPVERQIAKMLIENTGVNMLDSGGYFGRHWQENRKVEDFRKRPVVEIETEIDSEPSQRITYNPINKNQTTLKDFEFTKKPSQKTVVKRPHVNVPLIQKAPSTSYPNTPLMIKEANEAVEEIKKEAKQKHESERLKA